MDKAFAAHDVRTQMFNILHTLGSDSFAYQNKVLNA